MQRGDFDNLAGYGKPIDYKDRNPLLDATTYKINKMLKDEGFAPDWIMLEKDIRLGFSTEQWLMIMMISTLSFPILLYINPIWLLVFKTFTSISYFVYIIMFSVFCNCFICLWYLLFVSNLFGLCTRGIELPSYKFTVNQALCCPILYPTSCHTNSFYTNLSYPIHIMC